MMNKKLTILVLDYYISTMCASYVFFGYVKVYAAEIEMGLKSLAFMLILIMIAGQMVPKPLSSTKPQIIRNSGKWGIGLIILASCLVMIVGKNVALIAAAVAALGSGLCDAGGTFKLSNHTWERNKDVTIFTFGGIAGLLVGYFSSGKAAEIVTIQSEQSTIMSSTGNFRIDSILVVILVLSVFVRVFIEKWASDSITDLEIIEISKKNAKHNNEEKRIDAGHL